MSLSTWQVKKSPGQPLKKKHNLTIKKIKTLFFLKKYWDNNILDRLDQPS